MSTCEKIKLLIVDDEPLARDLIRKQLQSEERIVIAGECSNGFEAARMIQELNPDLVILDIQMPKITGFELLELLTNPPLIIFSTAYDAYAVKAFEANAVDYLLKPYPASRLLSAINKAIAQLNEKNNQIDKNQKILESISSLNQKIERVVIKSGSKIHVVPVETIEYILAEDDYVMIYTTSGKYLKNKTLSYFENHLDPSLFVRTHRSCMVRLDQIAELQAYGKDSWVAITRKGERLKVSRSGYLQLRKLFASGEDEEA